MDFENNLFATLELLLYCIFPAVSLVAPVLDRDSVLVPIGPQELVRGSDCSVSVYHFLLSNKELILHKRIIWC